MWQIAAYPLNVAFIRFLVSEKTRFTADGPMADDPAKTVALLAQEFAG